MTWSTSRRWSPVAPSASDPLATSDGEQQTIDWTYNPAAADLDWLRQGDTLTFTYVAQVDDGHGNVGAQDLVITITGTNDVPTFAGATNPAAIPEISGDSSAQDITTVIGTITITDQDVGDTLSLSVTGHATAVYNGGALPVDDFINVTALIASGAISFDPLATSDGEQPDGRLALQPGRRRSRLAAPGRHAHVDLRGPGQ